LEETAVLDVNYAALRLNFSAHTHGC